MADIFVQSPLSSVWFQLNKQSILSYEYITEELAKLDGVCARNVPFKLYNGCEELLPGSCKPWPQTDVFIRATASLAGGKGGFGSMLRAIGAQIEKTTNREACRDLSGRRLRDINEEKRLKDWVSKQADREKEREDRKQKKLDKLRQEYKHEFHDPEYFKARSEVTDKVHDALVQGIQASASEEDPTNQKKRKASDDGPPMKKTALWLGVSDDSDDSDSDAECKPGTSGHSSRSKVEKVASTLEDSGPSDMIVDEPCTSSAAKFEHVTPTPVIPAPQQEQSSVAVTHVLKTATPPTPAVEEPKDYPPIDLEQFDCPEELEPLGLNHLKNELTRRGLKCGGTLSDRASRLFSVKGLSADQIEPSLLAKPQKKK